MGAASSINGISSNIYISYDGNQINNSNLTFMRNELENKGINIICSKIMTDAVKNMATSEIVTNVQNILKNTTYFILCISKETIRSYQQAIEINAALNDNKKIIYLMVDESYTPLNNTIVKGIVGKNKWLPFYKSENVLETINCLIE